MAIPILRNTSTALTRRNLSTIASSHPLAYGSQFMAYSQKN
jgi:hypothetical protein